MDLATIARYEWVIMLGLPLALLLWELRKTKREIREAREKEARRGAASGDHPG